MEIRDYRHDEETPRIELHANGVLVLTYLWEAAREVEIPGHFGAAETAEPEEASTIEVEGQDSTIEHADEILRLRLQQMRYPPDFVEEASAMLQKLG